MATIARKMGPADHGTPLTLDDYETSDYELGYRYELINGRLYVSPEANLPEYRVEDWLFDRLKAYSRRHPRIINFVTNKARVFVPGRKSRTVPEPDLAAYHNFRNRSQVGIAQNRGFGHYLWSHGCVTSNTA